MRLAGTFFSHIDRVSIYSQWVLETRLLVMSFVDQNKLKDKLIGYT